MPSRDIHCAEDARRMARRRLPWMVFDYIDGAARQETGAARHRAAFDALEFQPHILRDVSQRSLESHLFGTPTLAPFGISPMGMCNLSTPGADLMLARIAARDRVPLGVSTVASTALEKMLEVAEGHAWFQLYFSGDGSATMQLVERARVAGYQTLVVTLDVPEVGRRPRELRHGFKMPFRIGPRQFVDFAMHPRWSLTSLVKGRPQMANFTDGEFDRAASRAAADWTYLQRLRAAWPGTLVIKGVLDVDDALRLRKEGVDAIQVSSHGGRQLDGAPPPILMLARMRAALGPDYPLFYDSGLRSGEDIVKAYAMGATFAFLGRPLLYAMAGRGERGLNQLWQVMTEEISLTLAQLGKTDMRGLEDCVSR
ncbi:MAG: alpha-hydroxy acid oxidase, partial [Roseovarius sp.]|nr:alpha-hydroxy acid oxidase [Roseovarius sp.]